MTKIKNTEAYPIKKYPVVTDFFIGSDSEDAGKTVNFAIQTIINMASGLMDYKYSKSSIPLTTPNGDGYFLTDGVTDFSLITTMHVSKITLAGQNLTPYINFLKNNTAEFTLKIISKTNQNVFGYFAINEITEFEDYFTFSVVLADGNNYLGLLENKDIYTFVYEKIPGDGPELITQTITDGDTTHSPSGNAVFDALAGKEDIVNKTDAITGSSSLKYPSEKAIVDYLPTILTQTITDGDTTHAPSSNAVFDALEALQAQIPASFTKIVYFNDTDPATATIFDLNNPPVTNDNTLKNNVNNLYIGTNSSTWVYKTSPAGYVTYAVTSSGSNFFVTGTGLDAGGIKTGSITKTGEIVIDSQTGNVSGLKLLQLPSKVLKTDGNGLVVAASFLQDVQYALPTQVITDGDTTHSPSGDAVYDALRLKANDANVLHTSGGDETKTGGKITVNNSLGNALHGISLSSGGIGVIGQSITGVGVHATSATGIGLRVNNPTGNTSNLAEFGLLSVVTKIDYLGNITGNSFIKTGGLATEFLKADGTVDSNTYLTSASITGKEDVSNKATNFNIVNNTLYPTVQAAKAYADSLVVGLLDLRGSYDASSNLFPTTGGSGTSGAVLKGDLWYVSVAGTLSGKAVNIGDSFVALSDSPGQTATNWNVMEANIGYVPANDTEVIHNTGNESFTGIKSATNTTTTQSSGLSLINSASGASRVLYISTTGSGYGAMFEISGPGNALQINNFHSVGIGVSISNANNGKGIAVQNAASGIGIESRNSLGGTGFYAQNEGSGYGMRIVNTSSGYGLNIVNQSTGRALNFVSQTASTGDLITFVKDAVLSSKFDHNGRYSINGGLATEYLKADGSVSTLTNPVTGTGTTGNVPKFTGAGTIGNSAFYDVSSNDAGVTTSFNNYSQFTIKGVSGGDLGGGSLNFANQVKTFAQITGETESAGNAVMFFRSLTGGTVTNKMTLSSNGNLGIGTTSPFTAVNQTSLSINGNQAGRLDLFSSGTRTGGVYSDSGVFNVGSVTNIPFTMSTNDIERVRILGNGSVGIGTSAVTGKFHVRTDIDNNFSVLNQTNGVVLSSFNDAVNANKTMSIACSDFKVDIAGITPLKVDSNGATINGTISASNYYNPIYTGGSLDTLFANQPVNTCVEVAGSAMLQVPDGSEWTCVKSVKTVPTQGYQQAVYPANNKLYIRSYYGAWSAWVEK